MSLPMNGPIGPGAVSEFRRECIVGETDYERLIHPDAPEPAQIKRLASIGVSSAAARNRLKQLSRSNRAHYFVEEMDFLGVPVDGELQDFPVEVRHRMAGRVGLNLVNGYDKVWSLNYFDTYWVNTEDAGWIASRALYRFKWNRHKTLLAERSLRMVAESISNDLPDLYDQLDRFSLADDSVAFLSAKDDFKRITADECEGLIKDSQEYFDQLEMYQALADR